MPPKSYKPTRERKQRRRSRQPEKDGAPPGPNGEIAPVDPHTEIMVPKAKVETALQMEEAQITKEPQMSAKKRKRFNKYMENKMKKEETAELLAKLAETKIDTSLFASTKRIGTSQESKKERIRRALREEEAGINAKETQEILYEHRRIPQPQDETTTEGLEDPEKGDGSEDETMHSASRLDNRSTQDVLSSQSSVFQKGIGTGLKRPHAGDPSEIPAIKRSKRARSVPKRPILVVNQPESETSDDEVDLELQLESNSGADEEYEEWYGFSESNSSEEGEHGNGAVESIDSDEDTEASESRSEEKDGNEGGSEVNSKDKGEGGEREAGLEKPGRSAKANAFKAWASSQRRLAVDGEVPGENISNIESSLALKQKNVHVPRRSEEDMTPPPELNALDTDRKAYHVPVQRLAEIEEQRSQLPVVAEEQRIMEAIHNHNCVVICGETGSGKTTQVPQFLFEAGYGCLDSPTPGLIGVTQPRRVAAVSMAARVGQELGSGSKEKVSYQIRFDGTVGPKTAIKFMTDGVLLRELANDFLLRKYSVIIIDEAHERSINTDILIGVLSRVLRLREQMAKEDPRNKPLKLVIMSATLRVSDFVDNTTLFPAPPPLLKVEARQHPVTIHFSRRTAMNYVEEGYKKICRIHRRLPPGGILVFMTGQNEILELQRKLNKSFKSERERQGEDDRKRQKPQVKLIASEAIVESEDVDFDLNQAETVLKEDGTSEDDGDEDLGEEMGSIDVDTPLHVLPLYSLLPTRDQLRVFEEPPDGSRLCVLATNIAETSLTIPGIRYVVDCGRSKERRYDKATGVQSFDIGWTSKASAAQRAGRAGRTGPGHCYRLYSSAVYERDFDQFSAAEVLRMPIEGVVLQMKAMSIDTIVNFPFPTPPDRQSLHKAEQLLGYLLAIDNQGALTDLGQVMNIFPLSPRFAKILIIGQQHGCLPYVIAIVAALSIGDIFIPEHQLNISDEDASEEAQAVGTGIRSDFYRAHAQFASLDAESDAVKLLSVVCAFDYEENPWQFCSRNFIRYKAMEETRKLRYQISKIISLNCPGVLPNMEMKLPPPSELQVKALKQIVAAGFLDQIAIRGDLLPNSPFKLGQMKGLKDVPYITLFPSSSETSEDPFDYASYVHQSSALYSKSLYPEYVIYSSLIRANYGKGRVLIQPLTTIKGTQLAKLAEGTPLITYSKPLESNPPKILPDTGGNRRECWVVPRMGAAIGRSAMGWALPPQKIVQKREGILQKWVKE